MSRSPFYVETAVSVLDQFVRDWQEEPLSWDTEHDIQAELYSRLTTAYRLLGAGSVRACYPELKEELGEEQDWNRVTCEPTICLPEGGKIRPDIVVWDDPKDWRNPGTEDDPSFFPIAWVCEIKKEGYWFRTGGLKPESVERATSGTVEADREKIHEILDGHENAHGCCLYVLRGRVQTGRNPVEWNSDEDHGHRLYVVRAALPPKEQTEGDAGT